MSIKILLSGSVLSLFLVMPASAQTTSTVVRENIPQQRHVIIANSPEDIALQEEIRKIRAYNAHIDAQVGISEIREVVASTPDYASAKIELFEASTANTVNIPVIDTSADTTPVVTIIERYPVLQNHRVAEGDTLYGFARNRCVSVADIQDMNDLESANIRLGQVLSLPATRCTIITASTGNATVQNTRIVLPVPTNANAVISNDYAVLPKDSLYSISQRYCVSVEELATHNQIAVAKAIQPGQILRLPETACQK